MEILVFKLNKLNTNEIKKAESRKTEAHNGIFHLILALDVLLLIEGIIHVVVGLLDSSGKVMPILGSRKPKFLRFECS